MIESGSLPKISMSNKNSLTDHLPKRWFASQEPPLDVSVQRAHPRCRVTRHQHHQACDVPSVPSLQHIHDSDLRPAMKRVQVGVRQNWSEKA